jgi:hypothetical protein
LTKSDDTAIDAAAGNNGSFVKELSGPMAGYWYIAITPETPASFKLKADEYLRVINLPFGTEYEVKELNPLTYIPSVKVDNGTASMGTLSMTLSTETQEITDVKHTVEYINERSVETPTGFGMKDLPFIGLIVLAAGLLVILVAGKSRKTKKQSGIYETCPQEVSSEK